MDKKFTIEGREYYDFELSNEDLINLIRSGNVSEDDKAFLKDKVVERFSYDYCKRQDETNDELFARMFGNFVNGRMRYPKKVAERMCREHRYLQQEMFKVCIAYIKELAGAYKRGAYDDRNEWAARTSSAIVELADNEENEIYI